MYKNSQSGNSFVESVGVFVILVAVLAAFLYGFSFLRHRSHMSDLTTTMSNFFSKYREDYPDLIKQKADFSGPIYLKEYKLMETCNGGKSALNTGREVCKTPLGEIDITVKYDEGRLYTYVYLHFMGMHKRRSCEDFLSAGWDKFLPRSWWGDDGYIGVISENTHGNMYFSFNQTYIEKDKAQSLPTQQHTKDVCKACKDSRYCSVLIFYALDN